ncbi:MAG: hypothetical protein KC420_03120 [Myxococcales bacterium]|nr:hypothetical protein [Myxococcales bacterium]
MKSMAKYRGLVYVKHGRVGSRSEGPDYYLQTYKGDFLLRYGERTPWEPDYRLEFYGRRMVEIEGKLLDRHTIQVETIDAILSPRIPQPEQDEPRIGHPFELKLGQSVHLSDAPLTVAFLSVEGDSRCPTGLTCVWEGKCDIVLCLTPDGADGQKVDLTVQGGRPDLAEAVVVGYHVEVHAVKPYPTAAQPQPDPSLYTAVVEIGRIE